MAYTLTNVPDGIKTSTALTANNTLNENDVLNVNTMPFLNLNHYTMVAAIVQSSISGCDWQRKMVLKCPATGFLWAFDGFTRAGLLVIFNLTSWPPHFPPSCFLDQHGTPADTLL
jgi:hypothetical protein